MHTKITTTSLLSIFAIVIAISLVTAISLLANPVLAVKHSSSKKGTSSSSGGGTTTLGSTSSSSSTSTTGGSTSSYDKFLSCISLLRAKLTKTDVDNCYSTAYASSSSGSSLGSSSSGSSSGPTSTSGSSPSA